MPSSTPAIPRKRSIVTPNIGKNKSPSAELAYRMPLAVWKEYRDGFSGDTVYPYTVGPAAKVVDFFNSCVFKKTYTKHVPIGADFRKQVSLTQEHESVDFETGSGYNYEADSDYGCEDENDSDYEENNEDTKQTTSLTELTKGAPLNKSGKARKLDVPIGIESVKQYKKALMALHEYQFNTRSISWPSPKVCKEVKDVINQYGASLIYDQVQTNVDRAAHCIIRDSYKIGQLINLLFGLWCSTSKFHLRERFSISSRHHMLLRDQDLRNLNYSDCFSNIVSRTQHRGAQQAVALIFCLDKGKTLKDGEVKFASAMRHSNIYRCPFSAFAFFMFSKLQEMPYFLDNPRWHNFKVLVDKAVEISPVQQYTTTKKIFKDYEILTTRVTHGGRHAGAMEAESLGIPTDIIKKGGGWKDRLNHLETHITLVKCPLSLLKEWLAFG
ncbi:unnamed protein product [Mucor hiemalis]